MEKHNDTHKLRQEGTCTWFPSTDAYKKWRVGGNQFLWLHGKGAVSEIRESPQLILQYVVSWLRKVGINVSPFVVYTDWC